MIPQRRLLFLLQWVSLSACHPCWGCILHSPSEQHGCSGQINLLRLLLYVSNPWTAVPIYTFSTWIGTKLLGVDKIIPPLKLHPLSFSYLLHEVSFLFWPFVFGSTLVALVSAVIGYIIVYHAVVERRR